MKENEFLNILKRSKMIGQGANGYVFKMEINSMVLTVKLVMKSKLCSEKKLYKVYNTLSKECKRYVPKPIDLGIEYVKYRKRNRGIIAYKYIEGAPFREYIKDEENHKHIPRVMKNIRKGLLCLWYSGFIHGDMHLDNVMVMPDKSIKIIDFSTCKSVRKLDTDEIIGEWFKKQWKTYYNSSEYNPNLALYDWKVMDSPGIWKHEKNIIQKRMASVK